MTSGIGPGWFQSSGRFPLINNYEWWQQFWRDVAARIFGGNRIYCRVGNFWGEGVIYVGGMAGF